MFNEVLWKVKYYISVCHADHNYWTIISMKPSIVQIIKQGCQCQSDWNSEKGGSCKCKWNMYRLVWSICLLIVVLFEEGKKSRLWVVILFMAVSHNCELFLFRILFRYTLGFYLYLFRSQCFTYMVNIKSET